MQAKQTESEGPRCLACGYDLTGNRSGRCPECGETFGEECRDYLLSGVDAEGRRIVKRVAAHAAEQAVAAMRDFGFNNIELHTDDIFTTLQPTGKERERFRKNLRPQLQLALLNASSGRASLHLIWESYRKLWPLVLAVVGLTCLQLLQRRTWSVTDWALTLLVAAVPAFVVLLTRRTRRTLDRLHRAAVDARWEEVLHLAVRLERWAARKNPGMRSSMIFWQAKALASLGRLEDVLAAAAAAREISQQSETWYLVQLAQVYHYARDFDAAIECYQQATEAGPDRPEGWLGLAEILAVELEQPREARTAFERFAQFPLASQSRAGLQHVEGAIALSEGRLADAIDNLEANRKFMIKLARGNPLAVGLQRITEALLSIAHARNGDRDAAIAYYRAAEPHLRRHRNERMLRRCQEALPEMATAEVAPA